MDVHVHVNSAAFLPLQRSESRSFDSLVGCGMSSSTNLEQTDQNLDSTEVKHVLDFCSPKEATWRQRFEDESDNVFFGMMNCLLIGKAAVENFHQDSTPPFQQHEECLEEENDSTRNLDQQQPSLANCMVCIRGIAIAIADSVRDVETKSLMFSRHKPSIMVSLKDKEKTAGPSPAQGIGVLYDARGYAPSCCWSISKHGLRRFQAVDSQHWESQTCIVHSIVNVTDARFRRLRLPSHARNALVLSTNLETPLVISISQRLFAVNLFCRMRDTLFDVSLFRKMLQKVGVTTE